MYTNQTWKWVIGSSVQWVIWVIFHVRVTGSPGHRVIILTRCETRVFPVFEKMPKMQNVHLKCWNDKSHCQVSVVGLKSLDVSPCNELLLLPMIIKNSLAWEYFFTHKSTFRVRYRTGSPGQLDLRVAGFPGHRVAGSQNVTQFHLWITNPRIHSVTVSRIATLHIATRSMWTALQASTCMQTHG